MMSRDVAGSLVCGQREGRLTLGISEAQRLLYRKENRMLTEARWIKNEPDALMLDDAYVCVTFRLKRLPDLPSDAPFSVNFTIGDLEYRAAFEEHPGAVMRRIARSAAVNAPAVHAAAGVSGQHAEARGYHASYDRGRPVGLV